MSYTIAVANEKGGVGKTTTVGNLAHALAKLGHRILVIDLDPQVNLTTWIGDPAILVALGRDVPDAGGLAAEEAPPTADKVLLDPKLLASAPRRTIAAGVDMIYGDEALAAIQVLLLNSNKAPYTVLGRALRAQGTDHDIVLIDCPPSLGLLYANAITAAQAVLVPVEPQPWAIEGLDKVIASIDDLVASEVIAERPQVRLLVTKFSGFDREAPRRVEALRLRDDLTVFERQIRHSEKLIRSTSSRRTIFDLDSSSAGALDYAAMAAELVSNE